MRYWVGHKCSGVLHKDPLSHRTAVNIFESASATSQSWHCIINKKVSCVVKVSRGGKASVKELSIVRLEWSYLEHVITTCSSSSTSPELQWLHSLFSFSTRSCLLFLEQYLPLSISSWCELILSFVMFLLKVKSPLKYTLQMNVKQNVTHNLYTNK